MELLLCLSQQENTHPYRFSGTGIQVYTFEEVLYHIYHNWKQSVDDITSPGLITWVHETLGLSRIAAKMKDIARMDSFTELVQAFLRITPYFDESEIIELIPQLKRWEQRLEWETYKERADDLMNRGEPSKAISLYRRALGYDENIQILNNLGIAYMQLEAYEDALEYFERAIGLEENNWELYMHYGEALILAGNLDEASKILDGVLAKLAPESAKPDILYLRGELALKHGKMSDAIKYFEGAIAASKAVASTMETATENQYVFRLADVYVKRRQIEKALDVLAEFAPDKENNLAALIKSAELHSMSDNLPAAIAAINKGIAIKPSHVELWVRLAQYHRLNYNLENANEAISKALVLDPSNERARLESARIQKGMGRTKSYQELLKGILREFKGRYREVN